MHRPGFFERVDRDDQTQRGGTSRRRCGQGPFWRFLPEITAAKNYLVEVRIIHELDQFTPEISPQELLSS